MKIHNFSSIKSNMTYGEKAKNIVYLHDNGFRVPRTFFVPYEHLNSKLANSYFRHISPKYRYAIRTSTDIEDGINFSYAGQFETYLNVEGSNINKSIRKIKNNIGKIKDIYGNSNNIKYGIIIQEMIKPTFSGVVFSKNPINNGDEIVIEIIEGLGENLVSKGKNPYRYYYKDDKFVESIDQVIPSQVLQEIVDSVEILVTDLKYEIDMEFVYDGHKLYWLQLRPISTIKEQNKYSSKFSKEFLPGIIKPLVWSINVPLVNSAWLELLGEIADVSDIKPEDLAKSFYYRAYFNMTLIDEIIQSLGLDDKTLEKLKGMEKDNEINYHFVSKNIKLVPKVYKLYRSRRKYYKKVDEFLKSYREEINTYSKLIIADYKNKEIIEIIDSLIEINKLAAYYNINAQLAFFINTYRTKKKLKKKDININNLLSQVDNDEKVYDILSGMKKIKEEINQLSKNKYSMIKSNPQIINNESFHKINVYLDEYIRKYGHLSENSNDFSLPLFKEDRYKVLSLIMNSEMPTTNENKGKVKFNSTIKQYARYKDAKEMMSFYYNYGYHLFREYFLKLGINLAMEDALDNKRDIFYLSYNQIKSYVNGEYRYRNLRELVLTEKKYISECRGKTLPEIIYGEEPPVPLDIEHTEVLNGIGASGGYHASRIKVINNINDFDKIGNDNIIVIPYSDISWMPVLTKAKGIISESGGILSHTAIIAREKNIPCVVSVQNVMNLPDDTLVRIDGYSGEIRIIELGVREKIYVY